MATGAVGHGSGPGDRTRHCPDPDQLSPDPFEATTRWVGSGACSGSGPTAIGPMFFGLQVGSVVGHLSQRALGQYPLAVPWAPSDELLLVTANIASFAEDWSLPEEEALLWVCARELASNSVLSPTGDPGPDGGAAPGAGRVLGRRPAGPGRTIRG